jgi:lipopolysaccharide heptosyltransferase I
MEAHRPPRSILVVRLGAVGDVIRTLPAVSCLRRTWPEARIAWAVEEPSMPILEDHPDVGEVLVLKRWILKAGMRFGGWGPALAHLTAFRATLRERGFDWAVDFQGTLKSAMIARLSGAPRTFGMGAGHARELSHVLYSDPIALPRGRGRKTNRVARALALAAALGADTSDPRKILPPQERAAAFARRFLETEAPARPRVLISPGTSEAQSFKRYPPDLFARLADAIAASGGTVILAWGPGEEPIVEAVRARMSSSPVVTPATRLPELAEILRGCDLFIGSDTGPLHLAAAVGVRTLAIYGPTNPAVNEVYSENPHLSLVGDVVCRPCRNRGCQNRSCLRLIDPAFAAAKALELLAAAAAGGHADLSGLIVAPTRR